MIDSSCLSKFNRDAIKLLMRVLWANGCSFFVDEMQGWRDAYGMNIEAMHFSFEIQHF